MRLFYSFLGLVLFITSFSLPINLPAQPTEFTHDEFRTELFDLLTSEKLGQATALVQQNQYKAGKVVDELLDTYLRETLAETLANGPPKLSKARQIGKIYQDLFQKDYYLEKVELYSKWNIDQKQLKAKADSLRNSSKQDYDQYKMKPALSKIRAALKIYKRLGDRESRARCLNRLGNIYLWQIKYTQAENHFKSAFAINQEIDYDHGKITSLNYLGTLNKKKKNLKTALRSFQKALEIAVEISDEESRAKQWLGIGSVYHDLEEYSLALDYHNKVLEFALENQNDPLATSVYFNLSCLATAKNNFDQVIQYADQGLVYARKSGNKRLEGAFLCRVGSAYRNTGLYPKALENLKKALPLTQKTYDRNTEGNILREIGIVFFYKGLPDSSLKYWNKAIDIFKSIHNWEMTGMVLGHLGVYYKHTGKPFKAIDIYEKALKLVRQTQDAREEANILGNMGNLYNDILLDNQKAESCYKQAIEIKKQLGEKAYLGILYGSWGNMRTRMGDYQTSLEFLYRALEIAQQTGDKAGIAAVYSHIGVCYDRLGNNEKAFYYFTRQFEILDSIGHHKSKPQALMNLGSIYEKMGKDSLALNYLEKSKIVADKQNQKYTLADININIGILLKKLHNYHQALQVLQKALSISKEISSLGQQSLILNSLGELNSETAKYFKALTNYKAALTIAQKTQSPEYLWQAQFGIGLVRDKQNRKREALKWYRQSIETIESIRGKINFASLKESFLEKKIKAYHAMIQILLKLNQPEEAFNYAERVKARSLLDILATDRIDITEGISFHLLEKKKKAEWQLRHTHELLTDAFSKKETEHNDQLISALQDSLNTARFEHEQVLHEIKINHPRYAQITGIHEPLKLPGIQQKILSKGVTLVEYLVTEDALLVWIVTDNSLNFQRLDISKSELNTLIENLLQPFRDVKAGKILNFYNIGYDLKLAHQIYQKIFQPIETYFPPKTTLIIVPDEILHYLPFEALITKIEKKPPVKNVIFARYENAEYLIKKYPVSYSASASVLNPELIIQRQDMSKGSLSFGNPQFEKEEGFVAFAEEVKQGVLNYFTLLTKGSAENGWTFASLPASENEVRTISKIIRPSQYYLGSDASEELFKEKATRFKYIHLSTHAIAEEKQPMYSRIVFALDDDPKEDGFLHAYEVLNLSLNANLVTLSACETGLGKLSRGEGLIGLTNAFLYAGASSVLVSLWSVDESTGLIMKYFYQNLKDGMNKTKALQKAKLSLLETHKKGMSFAHPFLWAPFVLMGSFSH